MLPPPRQMETSMLDFRLTCSCSVVEAMLMMSFPLHSRMDLWPPRLYIYLSQHRVASAEVSAWVRRHRPPICAFMPDRHPDPAVNTANQASFASFSRLLLDNQLVRSAFFTCAGASGPSLISFSCVRLPLPRGMSPTDFRVPGS